MKIKFIRILFFTLLGLHIPAVAYACPACVDSGMLYFYPFFNYWLMLLIFWVFSRFIFMMIGKGMHAELPMSYFKWPLVSYLYWGVLFFLLFASLRGGGLFFLLAYIVLPSWLVAYVLCFVKAWKRRPEHFLYRVFTVFQLFILASFILMIPLSYMVTRKVPYNVRVSSDVNYDKVQPAPGGR